MLNRQKSGEGIEAISEEQKRHAGCGNIEDAEQTEGGGEQAEISHDEHGANEQGKTDIKSQGDFCQGIEHLHPERRPVEEGGLGIGVVAVGDGEGNDVPIFQIGGDCIGRREVEPADAARWRPKKGE